MTPNPRFSPSQLVKFWCSPYGFGMDRMAQRTPELLSYQDGDDPLSLALQARGFAHEEALLRHFEQQQKSVEAIVGQADAYNKTLAAMERGIDVIVQGCLRGQCFWGFADFLVKVPGASQLGDYHYEIWDAKSAREIKPAFVMQLCCYTDMITVMQGRQPCNMVVALGQGDPVALPVKRYFATYQCIKQQFLAETSRTENTIPDPAHSRNWADWSGYAEQQLVAQDHLLLVADINRAQIKKLNQSGIYTMAELAGLQSPTLAGFNPLVLNKLRDQAKIQRQSCDQFPPLFRVIPPAIGERLGLALLPPPSAQDVFFDIEGFPLIDGGLEYLWGVCFFDEEGQRCFRDFWAHNPAQEKQAFVDFIGWVYGRWCRDPNMHIYHYANYEIAACRKLMGRYGACEFEVDQLLRNEVFVDLFKVVKSGILLGESRYSIKNVEHLYRGKRQTEVGSGGDSVVAYDAWREANAQGLQGDTWQTSDILNELRLYNIDDCESTQELVCWLREQQALHTIEYVPSSDRPDDIKDRPYTDLQLLRDSLIQRADMGAEHDQAWAKVTRLLAWLLEFHQRENKPVFWRLFDRLAQDPQTLLQDLDCLAFCRRSNVPPAKLSARARNLVYLYDFDTEQEFKGVHHGFYVLGVEDPQGKRLKVTWCEPLSDMSAGQLAVSAKVEPPGEMSLIPDEYINPDPIPKAIAKIAQQLPDVAPERGAIWDFLLRRKPRFRTPRQGGIVSGGDAQAKLHSVIDAVLDLDCSYLVIQGPPGTGKSYTAKHIIANLLQRGLRIGIASNSHKAINHLLLNCAEFCRQQNIIGHFVCTKETDSRLVDEGVLVLKNNQLGDNIRPGCLIGTTAWGFAREDLLGQLDYLFIDEAGQVALANLVAMSAATKNIVLLGDQMQLSQPCQGEHPEQSGVSCLDYLLHSQATVDEHSGVFLGITYRMHSTVNEFISEHFYDGKLGVHPHNDRRYIQLPHGESWPLQKDQGIEFLAVEHQGNQQASEEEVLAIVHCVKQLLHGTIHQLDGSTRALTMDDILFVAPYNHQVKKLRHALGKEAKVGSVDKFQGQEAAIVILSFCTSEVEDSPRGMEFLFDAHRINVALSRAQCLAVVVGNPKLGLSSPVNMSQLKLISLFNTLVRYGQPADSVGPA